MNVKHHPRRQSRQPESHYNFLYASCNDKIEILCNSEKVVISSYAPKGSMNLQQKTGQSGIFDTISASV